MREMQRQKTLPQQQLKEKTQIPLPEKPNLKSITNKKIKALQLDKSRKKAQLNEIDQIDEGISLSTSNNSDYTNSNATSSVLNLKSKELKQSGAYITSQRIKVC